MNTGGKWELRLRSHPLSASGWLKGAQVSQDMSVCDQVTTYRAGHVSLLHLRRKFSKTFPGRPRDAGRWWWGVYGRVGGVGVSATTSVTLAGCLSSQPWFPCQQNGDKKRRRTSQGGGERYNHVSPSFLPDGVHGNA